MSAAGPAEDFKDELSQVTPEDCGTTENVADSKSDMGVYIMMWKETEMTKEEFVAKWCSGFAMKVGWMPDLAGKRKKLEALRQFVLTGGEGGGQGVGAKEMEQFLSKLMEGAKKEFTDYESDALLYLKGLNKKAFSPPVMKALARPTNALREHLDGAQGGGGGEEPSGESKYGVSQAEEEESD